MIARSGNHYHVLRFLGSKSKGSSNRSGSPLSELFASVSIDSQIKTIFDLRIAGRDQGNEDELVSPSGILCFVPD